MLGLREGDMFAQFDIHERTRGTDGETDGHRAIAHGEICMGL